jgi:hypothetical protein
MPKATSKAQQRWFFAQAGKKGSKITMATAKKHARSGKSYKKLPNRKGKK